MDHRPVGFHRKRAMPEFETTALSFAEACEKAEVPYVFISFLAVRVWGRTRKPMDLDALVLLNPEQVERFANELRAQGLEASGDDFRDALEDRKKVIVSDPATGHQFDVKIATHQVEREEVAAGVAVPLSNGKIRVPRPEDVVAFGLARGTPRDLLDARSILSRQGDRIDLPRLKDLAQRLEVELVLASILDESS